MKLSQLSLADYNQLDGIPVINQDLSASGFTPVANTYYKHTGTTTSSYTNGVIYYYNSTGYAALDGSAPSLATVAKTGSYNDLLDKPTIPAAANNGTLTIQKNGTTVQTFTANQSSSVTANITVPTKTSELTNDSGFLTSHQDISGKANLSGGNTFTGKQTLNSPASDGYSINAAGSIKGSWLQSSAISNKGANTGKVCVFDDAGWIYYRTPAEILTEAGGAKSSDIPTDYVPTSGGTVTGNLTVGGNLTINGTTTTVDSTTLQVKDKLIEVAHGNTATLTTPAGLVAPKYDGTNSGALVFDSTGTAYVGDVTLKDGNIDVANSDLQPLATRTGLVGGNLVQYDSSAQTLKDSGKKISDLALKTDIPTNYVTTDTTQDIKGKKTVIPPDNKDNSNQIATTAWAGRRYKSIADFGFTSQTTVKAIVQKIIDNLYEYCTFACTNDNFNIFSDTPDGYGTLIIEVGSNALRPLISFTKQIGNSNGYKHWQANIVRGENNQVTEIQWYELALKTDIPTDYVKYTAQTLTNAQKSQSRSNIGAGTSNFSGNYSDLENIPTDIAKIGNLSNPNLLINPNFAINQRGKTRYTGDLEYTVDRWKKSYGILELLTNGEIKHTSSNSWQGVAQYIENPSRLAGKTVTISAMGRVEGATAFRIYLYYQIGTNARVTVCAANTTATTNTIISASGTIPADITDNDKVYFMLYNATANTSFYCKWAKLEIGSVATEFSPPSIAEELQKCYRYYKKIMNLQQVPYAGLGIVYGDGSGARMIVENTFRVNPTVTTTGAFVIVANGEYKTVSAMAMQSFNSTNVVVKFTLNSAVTEGLCGYLQSNNSPGAYIALDAEI